MPHPKSHRFRTPVWFPLLNRICGTKNIGRFGRGFSSLPSGWKRSLSDVRKMWLTKRLMNFMSGSKRVQMPRRLCSWFPNAIWEGTMSLLKVRMGRISQQVEYKSLHDRPDNPLVRGHRSNNGVFLPLYTKCTWTKGAWTWRGQSRIHEQLQLLSASLLQISISLFLK